MRKSIIRLSALVLLFSAGSLTFSSCKNKAKTEEVTVPIAPPPVVEAAPAPVVITANDSLTTAVADATKDFPTVMTTVNDGVITLTGEIKRDNLKTLMQSLNSLKPKKIENKLTIKL